MSCTHLLSCYGQFGAENSQQRLGWARVDGEKACAGRNDEVRKGLPLSVMVAWRPSLPMVSQGPKTTPLLYLTAELRFESSHA